MVGACNTGERMFDGIEVRNWNRPPHQTDHRDREQAAAAKAYEKALWAGSPAAILERARGCRKLGIELAVEDALPAVVALAMKGERVRYARVRRAWLARFTLDGSPAPDPIELDLTAACLDAIEYPCQFRWPALRCLASMMGTRGREVAAHALHEWSNPGF